MAKHNEIDHTGLTGTLPAAKDWVTDNDFAEDYPASPNVLDDEFEGSGSIDAKWTITNDPGANQTTYPGHLYVPLAELGTDNWGSLVRVRQTPPTGTTTMTYEAKVAISSTGHLGGEQGEFAAIGVYLGNSANSGEFVAALLQLNHTVTPDFRASLPVVATANKGTAGSAGSGFATVEDMRGLLPGEFAYIRLAKTTTAAYTSANTYKVYVSGSGLIWHEVATDSFTFGTACDEVGLILRRPKSQTGTPAVEAIADYFRRVV